MFCNACRSVPVRIPTVRQNYGVKEKVKCTLVQAMRLCTGRTAHRGSRGIALLFLDHGTRRVWGVNVTQNYGFNSWINISWITCQWYLLPKGVYNKKEPGNKAAWWKPLPSGDTVESPNSDLASKWQCQNGWWQQHVTKFSLINIYFKVRGLISINLNRQILHESMR